MNNQRPAPESIVEELLNDIDMPTRRNVISQMPELGTAIEHFLDLKRDRDERVAHLTLAWFYTNKLRPRFGGPKTMDTVRAYVRDILRRDPQTGGEL